MYDENLKGQIELFKSLFKGRDDVFAVRWEKGSKNGYMPKYQYDPYQYRMHKMRGGTFQNYNEKTHLPYSDDQIAMQLKEIDHSINMIRNDGRQIFLESQPQNFTRILHDYSDERKGFIIWKDLLEEVLS